jgi:Na+-translocating ferredoxin:NAD+ oxidoreductase subunit G
MSKNNDKNKSIGIAKTKSPLRGYLVPTLALVIISLVVTSALAFTYGITAPIIQKNLEEMEKKAAQEVLGDIPGVALKSQIKSYGGKLTLMVGISEEGEVTGVKILTHQDTPGLGTQPMKPDYLEQYIGLTDLPADHIDDDESVDAVTGATISSNAIYNGVKLALSDFNKTGGDQK